MSLGSRYNATTKTWEPIGADLGLDGEVWSISSTDGGATLHVVGNFYSRTLPSGATIPFASGHAILDVATQTWSAGSTSPAPVPDRLTSTVVRPTAGSPLDFVVGGGRFSVGPHEFPGIDDTEPTTRFDEVPGVSPPASWFDYLNPPPPGQAFVTATATGRHRLPTTCESVYAAHRYMEAGVVRHFIATWHYDDDCDGVLNPPLPGHSQGQVSAYGEPMPAGHSGAAGYDGPIHTLFQTSDLGPPDLMFAGGAFRQTCHYLGSYSGPHFECPTTLPGTYADPRIGMVIVDPHNYLFPFPWKGLDDATVYAFESTQDWAEPPPAGGTLPRPLTPGERAEQCLFVGGVFPEVRTGPVVGMTGAGTPTASGSLAAWCCVADQIDPG